MKRRSFKQVGVTAGLASSISDVATEGSTNKKLATKSRLFKNENTNMGMHKAAPFKAGASITKNVKNGGMKKFGSSGQLIPHNEARMQVISNGICLPSATHH